MLGSRCCAVTLALFQVFGGSGQPGAAHKGGHGRPHGRRSGKEVTVEIPGRVWETATAFVPEGAAPEERLPKLVAAAFEKWVRWMEGSFRPTSISELETSRAYELYDRLFLEEMPSADHPGGLLLLPMGRARYLMQALAYRHGRMLRERRAEHIRGALEAAEKDNKGATLRYHRPRVPGHLRAHSACPPRRRQNEVRS